MENTERLKVETLCKVICNELKGMSNVQPNDSIKQLRLICGMSECRCGELTPSQKLSMLLKVCHNNLTDMSVGLSIISNYNCLSHESHCQVVLENIIKHSLKNKTEDENRHNLLRSIWQNPGINNFSINTLEEFLFTESKFIEEDIFNAYEESLKGGTEPETLWKMLLYERIVLWSCKSPKVFCLVTSILNMWLQIIVKATNLIQLSLNVVTQFIISIRNKCSENKSDFVLLYPKEYHSLVTLLDINSNSFPEHPVTQASVTKSTVINEIQTSLQRKNIQTLCILTHFPEWARLINR